MLSDLIRCKKNAHHSKEKNDNIYTYFSTSIVSIDEKDFMNSKSYSILYDSGASAIFC